MNLENTAERLAGLASLLYAGCGLPAWCFDKEGGLYFTTSAYGKELGMFLEIGGCKEFAMTKGTEGNMAYENIVGDNYLQKPPRNYMTGDSLREAKDILIIFTSQCCNAAIEGKMSIKAAKELEAAFIHKIEKSRTVTQLTGLRHQMMQEYISKVHELRLVSEISRPIRLCCDYVNAHFMEPMKLGDIAKEVGYTEYYLTRKFQREMGERLWDYVRNVRLDYAKILLISTECTVQEISERCQFGSRNYFTRMFRAREGASPKEYRERARNLDLPGDGTWVKMNSVKNK